MTSRSLLRLFRTAAVPALAVLGLSLSASPGAAQTLTYRFQLSPWCDQVVLTFIWSGSPDVLQVAGYDDNCGDLPRSPLYGTAVLSPDGSATIGYTTSLPVSVYDRGGDVGLQTNVEIPANSPVGYWSDDDGNSGTFTFDILSQPSG
jgi:hypothetical protein